MPIADWFRPKWKHSDPLERLAAVERLANPQALAFLAKHDADRDVRIAALLRSTDAHVIEDVARADSDPTVRRIAVERLSNQGMLAEIVRGDADPCVRQAAAAKVTSQDVLVELARSAAHTVVRKTAVARVADEVVARLVAVTDASPEVRQAAVLAIADWKFVLGIAATDADLCVQRAARRRAGAIRRKHSGGRWYEETICAFSRDSEVRKWVLPLIVNVNLLLDVARLDEDEQARSLARTRMRQLSPSPEVARRIAELAANNEGGYDAFIRSADEALTSPTSAGRRAAANRLRNRHLRTLAVARMTDPEDLAHFASHDPEPEVRTAAAVRMIDEPAVAGIAKNDSSASVREAATKRLSELAAVGIWRIDSPSVLAELALKHSDARVRMGAVMRLDDESALMSVLASESEYFILEAAVENLASPTLLARVAQTHPKKSARETAVRLLSEESLLATTARDDQNTDVREAADEHLAVLAECKAYQTLAAIQKQTELLALVRDHAEVSVRRVALAMALRGDVDQNELRTLARDDPDARIRQTAVAHLNDETILADLTRKDSDGEVRKAAVRRIRDKAVLQDLVKNGTPHVRYQAKLALLDAVTDQAVLVKMVRTAETSNDRWDVLRRITDRNLLWEVVGVDGVMKYMILEVEDQSMLTELAIKYGSVDAADRISDPVYRGALRAIVRARNGRPITPVPIEDLIRWGR
jgi:hypothetical protein